MLGDHDLGIGDGEVPPHASILRQNISIQKGLAQVSSTCSRYNSDHEEPNSASTLQLRFLRNTERPSCLYIRDHENLHTGKLLASRR